MNWRRFDLNDNDCILEHTENGKYNFQAELIKLQPVFGNYPFGNFELNVSVFNKTGNIVEQFSLNGLNGKMKGAIKQLDNLKQKAIDKYGYE